MRTKNKENVGNEIFGLDKERQKLIKDYQKIKSYDNRPGMQERKASLKTDFNRLTKRINMLKKLFKEKKKVSKTD